MTDKKVTIEEGQEAALNGLAGDAVESKSADVGGGDFDARQHIDMLAKEAEQMPTSELIQSVLVGGSAVAAGRGLGHWALTDQETAIMGVAVGDVLDKYMPSFKAGPEVALVLVSFTVFMPKYAAHIQSLNEAAEKKEGVQDGRQS